MKPQQKNVFPITGECSFIPPLPIPSCFLYNNIWKQLKSEIYFDIYLYLKRYKYKFSANKCVSHQRWVLIYISIISSESLLKYYQNNLHERFILIIFLHLYKNVKPQQINVFPISAECSFISPLPLLPASSSVLGIRLLS